jgi:multiple sugar transport system permease protein
MRDLRLLDTPWSLIIIYSALMIPFATWMMKSFFDSIPIDLEEAAMIDGTTKVGALRHVTIPLAAPGLAATAIFVYVLSWNEFMFAFMFTSVKSQTIPVVLSLTLGEMQIYWQRMAAEATIIILPVLIFSYFLQRHMVKGLTAGALK